METPLLKIWHSWHAGGWTMIPIALVAAGLYITGIHLWFFMQRRRFARVEPEQLRQWVQNPSTAEGEVGEVVRYTQDGVNSLPAISSRFAEVMNARIPDVDRRITTLNVLVAAAPLLGLLGTVLGMLVTFRGIAAGGGKTVDVMAQGISTALITTEMGLLVALPGMLIVYLVKRSRNQYVAFLTSLESLTLRHFRSVHSMHGMTRVFTRKDFAEVPKAIPTPGPVTPNPPLPIADAPPPLINPLPAQ
ncbi:MAG: MotA/TolQ/ExbB proton channel family protein [Verrucomicrobiae bacterium]|nr:MotA/TolQ/ExbB proton channel family protein [Verrucomicrobiae bacterium]